MLPSITSYGQYKSSNYGLNTLRVNLGTITLYYSYNTIVAYRDFQDGLVCSENRWSVTTGKHLNWIEPVHACRRGCEMFDQMLAAAIKRHIKED